MYSKYTRVAYRRSYNNRSDYKALFRLHLGIALHSLPQPS